MVERVFVNEQAGLDQLAAGVEQLRMIEVEHALQARIGVVAQALGIGDGDQDQVKGQGGVVTALEVTVTDQALIDPTELSGNAAEPFRTQDAFVDFHGLFGGQQA